MYQRKRYPRAGRTSPLQPTPPVPPSNPRPVTPPPPPPTQPPPPSRPPQPTPPPPPIQPPPPNRPPVPPTPFPFSSAQFRSSSPPIPVGSLDVDPTSAEEDTALSISKEQGEADKEEAIPVFRTPQNEALLRKLAEQSLGEKTVPVPNASGVDAPTDIDPLPPLPQGIVNPPAQTEPSTVTESQAQRSPANFFSIADRVGRLKVETFLKDRAAPVEGVHLIISNDLDGQEFRYYEADTDQVGIAEGFLLPATDRDRSLSPDQAAPYTTYYVRAEKAGFLPVPPLLVQIYENVTTVLPIVMQLDFGKEAGQ